MLTNAVQMNLDTRAKYLYQFNVGIKSYNLFTFKISISVLYIRSENRQFQFFSVEKTLAWADLLNLSKLNSQNNIKTQISSFIIEIFTSISTKPFAFLQYPPKGSRMKALLYLALIILCFKFSFFPTKNPTFVEVSVHT